MPINVALPRIMSRTSDRIGTGGKSTMRKLSAAKNKKKRAKRLAKEGK